MSEADKPDGRRTDRKTKGSERKKYAAPKLIEYGSTSKLSASKPGTTLDGANSIHMTPK